MQEPPDPSEDNSKVSKSNLIQHIPFSGLMDNSHWYGSKSFLGNALFVKYAIFCVILLLQFEVAKTQHTPST